MQREPILAFPWQHSKGFYIVDSYMYVNNNIKETYCCVSVATVVTRMCHNVTFMYIAYLISLSLSGRYRILSYFVPLFVKVLEWFGLSAFFMFVDPFAKLRKEIISFVMIVRLSLSVRPSAWNNWAPADGFSLNLIFEDFAKICRENSSFIKM
jgi:hypothetical protein